ncbi:hypothetical protein F8M41_022779 [Gigaspora margarita]|uniref:Uncharacterized protein n=1 Tax=Gigaspora margarita TaxID=4874 RepID=A0A8H4AEJ5_GIGMA|nr:hypothetical protein F8M41_022779 [Gigaspora margarita]
MTKTKLPILEVCSTLKVFLAQGFGDNIEIGQIIFVGPGVYLFSPFTIPPMFEKFSREGQKLIMKPKNKYPTRVTPERPNAVTFAIFTKNIERRQEQVKRKRKGRGRGKVDKEFAS